MGLRGGGGHVEKDRRKCGYDEQEMEKKWRQTRKTTKRLKKNHIIGIQC